MQIITDSDIRKATGLRSDLLGKWLEKHLSKTFRQLENDAEFRAVRLHDTAAAGNFLPATDGDYILMCSGTGILLEAKCSAKYDSLASCASSNISKGQILSQRLWSRAGGTGLFVFASVLSRTFQVWDGLHVAKQRVAGSRLDAKKGVILTGGLQHMPYELYDFFNNRGNGGS